MIYKHIPLEREMRKLSHTWRSVGDDDFVMMPSMEVKSRNGREEEDKRR